MKILKFFVVIIFFFGLLVFSYGYLDENGVIDTITEYYNRTPSTLINNDYSKYIDVSFVSITDDFTAKNKQDIMNIYYTIISSGMNEFVFYCSNEYTLCTSDVVTINNDITLLSQMNNFVNIYNSFKSIKTTYTSNGKITLSINRIYSNEDVELLNNKVDEIYNSVIGNSTNEKNNIKKIHDYIINNTRYNVDEEKLNQITTSSTAIGSLINGLATCNGYTDAMGLFLDKMGISNVRISNNEHIWNLVYLNGKWLHLDLTWDDPVNNLNQDRLEYTYFLKTTNEMEISDEGKDKDNHSFNKDIYYFVS